MAQICHYMRILSLFVAENLDPVVPDQLITISRKEIIKWIINIIAVSVDSVAIDIINLHERTIITLLVQSIVRIVSDPHFKVLKVFRCISITPSELSLLILFD